MREPVVEEDVRVEPVLRGASILVIDEENGRTDDPAVSQDDTIHFRVVDLELTEYSLLGESEVPGREDEAPGDGEEKNRDHPDRDQELDDRVSHLLPHGGNVDCVGTGCHAVVPPIMEERLPEAVLPVEERPSPELKEP